jgi:hypothetical protein
MHRPMMSGMIVHARIVAVKLARFRPISMDARVRFPMRRRDLNLVLVDLSEKSFVDPIKLRKHKE